ncbi:hypothetical protein ACKGJN_16765, partial [Gillisia sp. Q332]|uniref:hypothetical protein n=1 Tax=Gillisia xinjiangensis TaxID=3384765 RepID=UPI00391A3E56
RLYGDESLYTGGLSVRTTLDPHLQDIANRVLREGLIDYDRRHGWRGPLQQIAIGEGVDLMSRLQEIERPVGIDGSWQLAAVVSTDAKQAEIMLSDGNAGHIPMDALKWARKWIEGQRIGNEPKKPGEVLQAGDVVLVEALQADSEEGDQAAAADSYALRQTPDVNGGLVALDPHTG